MPSLRHLLFVSPAMVTVEAWHRADDGGWPNRPAVLTHRGDVIRLTSVGAELPLADIYLDLAL